MMMMMRVMMMMIMTRNDDDDDDVDDNDNKAKTTMTMPIHDNFRLVSNNLTLDFFVFRWKLHKIFSSHQPLHDQQLCGHCEGSRTLDCASAEVKRVRGAETDIVLKSMYCMCMCVVFFNSMYICTVFA
jgi:hypothetical protein